MKTEIKKLNLPEGPFSTKVGIFEPKDLKTLKAIYEKWRDLCVETQKLGARGINLPDILSEGSFCYFFKCWRTNKAIKGAKHSSFDAFDPLNNKRIQIKASSIKDDLTSFGPESVWDDLYFVDFYKKGNWDLTFDVYLIPDDKIYNMVVNQEKNETFADQQKKGRRPRFSIMKKIIKPENLKPKYTCNLKTGTCTVNF